MPQPTTPACTGRRKERWRERDPITRLERFLEGRGEWDDVAGEKVAMETADLVESAIAAIEARPTPGRDDAVRHAFFRIPEHVVEQLHAMQRSHGEPETRFSPDEIWQVGHDRLRPHRELDHGTGHQRRPPAGNGTQRRDDPPR